MSTTTAIGASAATISRVVRLVAVSVAVGIMGALGALQPIGSTTADTSANPEPTAEASAALNAVIATQQSNGLTCSADPTLTDTVLYQFLGSNEITVLSFNQALNETAARSGWVRSYCA